jgi:hypothetical protein
MFFKLVWPYSEKKKSDDGQAGVVPYTDKKKVSSSRRWKIYNIRKNVYKGRARARGHACDRRKTRKDLDSTKGWMLE